MSPAPGPEASAATTTSAAATDDNVIRRSADAGLVVFPVGRLQVDSYLFRTDNKAPNETFLIRRARVEVGGWIGGLVYFHLSGDFAGSLPNASSAPSASLFSATDNFIAVAPWRSLAMLQVGRFDAPFTLENRTRDTDLDFMERSLTVRALGIPDNKQVGAMLHGTNASRNFMYSAGVFNGDGPSFQNMDRQFDFMGRAWIAPFSFKGDGALHDATIGGSAWAGDRSNTSELPNQTTQGGFTFLDFAPQTANLNGNLDTPVQLRQVGRMTAFAGELNVPVSHKYGVRGELVWKHSPLSHENVTNPGSGIIVGGAHLEGYAAYGEVWFWALGDDRIVGDQQGLQPYPRTRRIGDASAKNGLMLAFRLEYLNEDLSEEADSARLNLGNRYVGNTKVNSYGFGINYWRASRFRATFNYVFNHIAGDTAFIAGLASPNEHEFLFRLAIAL